MSGDVHSASFISPVTKKAESKNASESEGWSEPDRSVSSARMGLALSENNSIASILLKKSSSGRSSRDSIPVQSVPANYSDSSVSCSGAAGRRSRSDPHDLKSLNRLRALEQENHSLRSQLTQVVDNLRSTWREQQLKVSFFFPPLSQFLSKFWCLDQNVIVRSNLVNILGFLKSKRCYLRS